MKNLAQSGPVSPVRLASAVSQIESDSTTVCDNAILGDQLTRQYGKVKHAIKDIIILGAMLITIRDRLEKERPENHTGRGRYPKGSGLEPWLERWAPELSYRSACRFIEIAEGLKREFNLGKRFDLVQVLQTPAEAITDERLLKKRGEILSFIEGKSCRQLMISFQKGQHGAGGGHDRSKDKKREYTPEETEALCLQACRDDFMATAEYLTVLKKRLKYTARTITDADRDSLAELCERVAAECRAYNATPLNRRSHVSGIKAITGKEEP